MATIAQVMTAVANQLRDELQPQTDIALHIEDRAFLAAETPAIDMLVTSPTGLEAGLQGYGDLTVAIPLTLRVRVSTADLITGEELLLAFMDDEDPLSIIAALDSDHTLGGWAQDVIWDETTFPWSGYTDFPDINGDGILLGATCQIVVLKGIS